MTQRIAITGSSGLVGQALIHSLRQSGHEVIRFVRRDPESLQSEVRWDPNAGVLNPNHIEGLDAVVHLAGESIASGRWTDAKKQRIRQSRVQGTESLCRSLTSLTKKPKVLISASAIGYYGSRGDEFVDEQSTAGTGYLAEVCQEWENATNAAVDAGIRTVNLRIGVVLSPDGGALAQMLTPFRLGLGGRVGSGAQYCSWIALPDLVRAIEFAIEDDSLAGPVNAVGPNPVTNRVLTKSLASTLNRPAFIPLPAFAAKLAFGEMAEELLLSSTRVVPRNLSNAGFEFRFAELPGALEHLLKSETPE